MVTLQRVQATSSLKQAIVVGDASSKLGAPSSLSPVFVI
jgi:hypothetical protein